MKDKQGTGKRGKYNPACDVCARKKTKCDGNKPVCLPCQTQGRQNECAWTKNPVRKPRTEQHFEAMFKRAENLRVRAEEYRKYADYLESLLDECHNDFHTHRRVNFRVSRPSDADGLLGQSSGDAVDHDYESPGMGAAEEGDESDPGNNPTKEICSPAQTLENDVVYGNTAPFRFEHLEISTRPSRFPELAENPHATYVLLVDGVNEEHCNPDLDWSRHLSTSVPLDRRSHDRALDLLFKFFTSWCLRIVPPLFLRDMYRACSAPLNAPPPKTPHYSPMLHNALVSLALAFLDDPQFCDIRVRQHYANMAKSFIESECRKPNLSVVHALSMLASFHSSQGDQTLGYMYFGMSARMAQALGLNIDCSDWVKMGIMDESDQLDRRWANWATFAQDVCWSLYVGRDFSVSAPLDADAKEIVAPFVDSEFDQMPFVHPPARIEPQPNYLTKTFEATCELLLISRRIMDVVNGLSRSHGRPIAVDGLISEIDLDLNSWRNRLAPQLEITVKSRATSTPHKLMLHLAYWWLFILLHRPFFHRKARPIYTTDKEIDHVKLCRRAAENIMELSATYRTLYGLRYCPVTLIQTVFSAGTVYLLTAIQAGSGARIAQKELRNSLDQQKLVMTYLLEIGKSWQGATNIAGILKGLMEEQVKPILERKAFHSNPGKGLPAPEYEDEDNGQATSSTHSRPSGLSLSLRRHGSVTKAAPQRRHGLHSRCHSVGQGSPTVSATPPSQISHSPTILISPVQQPSFLTLSKPSSVHSASSMPTSSSPIAIKRSPTASNSLFSSSPSNLPDSGLRPRSIHNGSPSPSTSPVFSGSFPGSPSGSTAFVHRPSSFQSHSPLANFAHRDESSKGSPPVNYAFQGRGNHYVPPQGFGNTHSSYQYPGKELAGALGMLGGQTLPQAPFIGPFSLTDPIAADLSSPEEIFATSNSPSSSYPAYDSSSIEQAWNIYLESSASSQSVSGGDANMDDVSVHDQWDAMWSHTFDS